MSDSLSGRCAVRDRAEIVARLHLVMAWRRRWYPILDRATGEDRIAADRAVLTCDVEISTLRWALGEEDGDAATLSREP
jgi:hypothetical protein